jgi:hypothetical protein
MSYNTEYPHHQEEGNTVLASLGVSKDGTNCLSRVRLYHMDGIR